MKIHHTLAATLFLTDDQFYHLVAQDAEDEEGSEDELDFEGWARAVQQEDEEQHFEDCVADMLPLSRNIPARHGRTVFVGRESQLCAKVGDEEMYHLNEVVEVETTEMEIDQFDATA